MTNPNPPTLAFMNEGSGEPEKPSELQFDKVEVASPGAARTCPACHKLMGDEYYEVNGNAVCSSCAASIGQGGDNRSLVRAFSFGAGAAVVSAVVWYLIIKVSDSEWGLVAIAVGLFVGFAVRYGAAGAGGWRYQALAMVLTYCAVTASKVPFVVEGLRQARSEDATAETSNTGKPAQDSGSAAVAGGEPAAARANAAPGLLSFVLAWAFVFGIALASPFFGGIQNFMGFVIIAIALYEAWKLNKRVPVNGPFRFGSALPTA
jgi:hypothetical protein